MGFPNAFNIHKASKQVCIRERPRSPDRFDKVKVYMVYVRWWRLLASKRCDHQQPSCLFPPYLLTPCRTHTHSSWAIERKTISPWHKYIRWAVCFMCVCVCGRRRVCVYFINTLCRTKSHQQATNQTVPYPICRARRLKIGPTPPEDTCARNSMWKRIAVNILGEPYIHGRQRAHPTVFVPNWILKHMHLFAIAIATGEFVCFCTRARPISGAGCVVEWSEISLQFGEMVWLWIKFWFVILS